MYLAKLTEKGQITLSPDVRKKLGVKGGDKVVLIENEDGYLIANSSRLALRQLQQNMEGSAEKLGLKNLDDVVEMIHNTRDK